MTLPILFKPIPNFSDYIMDRNANIYSFKSRRFLSNTGAGGGYKMVYLFGDDGKRKNNYLHRLVALTWIENPLNLPVIDHIDRNKNNNSINNLRWSSYSDNRINSGKNFNNKIGYKHIVKDKYSPTKSRYRIHIHSKGLKIYSSYDADSHSLQDIIDERNRLLTLHNLPIID